MVNFLSIFCPELQKLLKPIYDLTRKGRQFIWGEDQQSAFEEINHRLVKLPMLHLPDSKRRFHLYSDTSKFATGSVLYQIQNGKHCVNSICKYKVNQTSEKLFYYRIRNVWISHKHC